MCVRERERERRHKIHVWFSYLWFVSSSPGTAESASVVVETGPALNTLGHCFLNHVEGAEFFEFGKGKGFGSGRFATPRIGCGVEARCQPFLSQRIKDQWRDAQITTGIQQSLVLAIRQTKLQLTNNKQQETTNRTIVGRASTKKKTMTRAMVRTKPSFFQTSDKTHTVLVARNSPRRLSFR